MGYKGTTIIITLMMILPLVAGCQSADDTDAPARNDGRAISATLSDIATAAPVLPTRVIQRQVTTTLFGPSPVPVTPTPTEALGLAPTLAMPQAPAATMPPLASKTPSPMPSLPPTFTPVSQAAPQTQALFAEFIFGQSVEGRDLRGYRIGMGSKMLVLVGAVHGGFEDNTTRLIEQLAGHFRVNPQDILPDTTLLLIPALNPDGLARGRVLAGRFNANNVDLNRNWGCGWSETAYFRDQTVNAGSAPLSEPETQALASLIQTFQPSAVLFYHAAAAGVFAGNCGGHYGSDALAEAYGLAANYAFDAGFSAYPVTGTAPAWVNSLGIPSADVELASATDTEFDRNLLGILAVQHWLAQR